MIGTNMVKQMEHFDSMPRFPIMARRSSSRSSFFFSFSLTLGSVIASISTLSFNKSTWSVANVSSVRDNPSPANNTPPGRNTPPTKEYSANGAIPSV